MTSFNIVLIGFNDLDSGKIAKIFHLSQTRPRNYHLKTLTDKSIINIVLVNIDADFLPTLSEFQKLNPGTHTVTYSKKKEADKSSYHIKGMLLATRLLKVLDNLPITASHNKRLSQQPDPPVSSPTKVTARLENVLTKSVAPQATPVVASVTEDISTDHFKVLVVDDSDVMQKSLALELQNASESIKVFFANTGEAALNMVSQNQYDFIFLDVMMPGIDGYETCTEIRKIESMKKTPVIMLSAKTSPLDEVKGVMAGCTSYLTKPIQSIEFQKMLARVMKWLENYQQTQKIKEI